jgi:hypothetical protein
VSSALAITLPGEEQANVPVILLRGSVLSHLEKVQRLPADVQVDIAKRIDSYIKLARAANNEDLLAPLALGAMEEQAKAIGQGVNSTMDPRWAAPAIAEAWCYATISLSKGYLDPSDAKAIISAIEAFASSRAQGDFKPGT